MSASTSGRRPKPKGRIKVGICENHNYTDPRTGQTGDCPRCASGERMKVEVQRLSDFRCPVCGERLTPVKESKWMLWVGIAAVIAAICAVCCWWIPKGCTSGGGGIDTVDIVGVEEPIVDLGVDSSKPEDPTKVETDTINRNGGGGTTGPTPKKLMKPEVVLNGAAVLMSDSEGNKYLRFESKYEIDLKKYNDEKITVGSGYELKDIKIQNNSILSGTLYHNGVFEKRLDGLNLQLKKY